MKLANARGASVLRPAIVPCGLNTEGLCQGGVKTDALKTYGMPSSMHAFWTDMGYSKVLPLSNVLPVSTSDL